MKNCNTIFGQLLQIISRYEFEKAVTMYKTDKYSKGFSTWDQFVSLLFGQLCGFDSLRSIVTGLSNYTNKLYHLGINIIKRSTLAYANSKRSYKVFQSIFYYLLDKTMKRSPNHKFKFKNPLYSIDATTIDLCLSLYDWAKFRKTKGGIKLHVKLNHSGYIPCFAVITEAKKHEKNIVKDIPFNSGDVVVFDRGYNDYKDFLSYCNKGIYFVTRLKKNANYKVVKDKNVNKYKNILSDQIIEFEGFYSQKRCPVKLRIIRSINPVTNKTINILTNQLKWSAQTISRVYKDRWQIEIFFKNMKQKLKIKSFLGTSENALNSQIWVALISYLLLCYLKFVSDYSWTIYKLMTVLPLCIFRRCDLWAWLNKPFEKIENKRNNDNQMILTF